MPAVNPDSPPPPPPDAPFPPLRVASKFVFKPDPPPPPPAAVRVPNCEGDPSPPANCDASLAPAPPPPTMIEMLAPGVTAKFVDSTNPPAPPPPPSSEPPPPPPPITRAQTFRMPAGIFHPFAER